jgi:hypothetical protein
MDWREAIDARAQIRLDYQARRDGKRKAELAAAKAKRARRKLELQNAHEFPKL